MSLVQLSRVISDCSIPGSCGVPTECRHSIQLLRNCSCRTRDHVTLADWPFPHLHLHLHLHLGHQILWFGNGFGKGKDSKTPTYVFPIQVRNAIRKRFPEADCGQKDEEYDAKEGVLHVSMTEFIHMKWPTPPKSCAVCMKGRGKPY